MVRPAETIRGEIDRLNRATLDLAAEFNQLYHSYLDCLGVATRHQLVMAVYHLCTQVYPEGFLALSVSQQEKLQRQIRQLGQKAQDELSHLLDPPRAESDLPTPDEAASAEADRPTWEDDQPPIALSAEVVNCSESSALAEDSNASESAEPVAPSPPATAAILPDPRAEQGEGEAEAEEVSGDSQETSLPLTSLIKSMVMAALAEDNQTPWIEGPLFTGDGLTPTQLAKHHLFLERQIRRLLRRLSKQANQLLQAAQVLPNLPEAVLDAASESEVGPSRGRSVPNVLNVLVALSGELAEDPDTELNPPSNADSDTAEDATEDEEDEPSEGMMTHLAAVNLCLSDIEFTDVQTSLGRSKLRTTLGRLRKLGKQYQKAQRELAIAEAEQAWRAVWYDDSSS
ncbi:MAG TPA: hypothetical protein IGR64_11140 [Leptolyngbyaceae cyanobacterium M65_K2018_010]|nr:hypothetical protein [Leptolyngbyaceae cyanobacterium M65_K2018_010]